VVPASALGNRPDSPTALATCPTSTTVPCASPLGVPASSSGLRISVPGVPALVPKVLHDVSSVPDASTLDPMPSGHAGSNPEQIIQMGSTTAAGG
jgi:hypothetical protein